MKITGQDLSKGCREKGKKILLVAKCYEN